MNHENRIDAAHVATTTTTMFAYPLAADDVPAGAVRAQDTGKFRTNRNDQFYTKDHVARTCVQHILHVLPCTRDYLWIEPSAGGGAFLHALPPTCRAIGLDVEPAAVDVHRQDYLTWIPPPETDAIVFGNPPFGRQSSLAKAFIAKSCGFAQVIAFVLPRSFTKPSMFSAFTRRFHMRDCVELHKASFVVNGNDYDVPCVFQIWQRADHDRVAGNRVHPDGFVYVKSTEPHHLVFRRVGGRAGRCSRRDARAVRSVQSHYFIRLDEAWAPAVDAIVSMLNVHPFPNNTLGPRSLSKSEASAAINTTLRLVAPPVA